MKVLERVVDSLIRDLVTIDENQFGFMPGKSTTDAIFVVRQLQEKYLVANRNLYMAFVSLWIWRKPLTPSPIPPPALPSKKQFSSRNQNFCD